MRVLIADDDATYRQWLEMLLSSWGFDPQVVCDGDEAMAALRRKDAPRLILVDWCMPGADGFEVARFIRRQAHTRDAYVLMITGSRRKEDMLQVLVCGADDYLLKPFDPMDLKIHLRSATRILGLTEELEKLRGQVTATG
ncbi:MAG: response regulator transcription factor [Phycisphaerae bacterium]|jgi:DNA-binding response OmpR family regulator|nr:response regulator transcription factor [Phycisphaerae bacterium]